MWLPRSQAPCPREADEPGELGSGLVQLLQPGKNPRFKFCRREPVRHPASLDTAPPGTVGSQGSVDDVKVKRAGFLIELRHTVRDRPQDIRDTRSCSHGRWESLRCAEEISRLAAHSNIGEKIMPV